MWLPGRLASVPAMACIGTGQARSGHAVERAVTGRRLPGRLPKLEPVTDRIGADRCRPAGRN